MIPKDKIIGGIFESTAKELGIPRKTIEDVWVSQFEFIRNKVDNLDLRKLTEEEFVKTKKNFNIPKLFKFYASLKQKQRIENINFNKFKHESNKNKGVNS